jgi:Kef-type K+ transport system membrane component KefB
MASLFVGGTLTATSIGVTMRVLSDLKLTAAKEAQIVLGAAVIDDVLGVIVLALLYEFSVQGSVSFANASRVLLFITLFLVIAPLAAKSISLLIRHLHYKESIPGLIPTTIVSLVLFFAWLAHAIGAPELLGGFAAGLALSRRFFLPFGLALHTDKNFSETIETQMRPIIQLFTPIFFVMVGLSLSLHEIDWSSPFIWGFSAVLFVVAVVSKYAGVVFLKESWVTRGAIGMAMVPRGEVGLIFAELGRLTGVFNNEVHAGLVIVIMLTTLLAPLWMKFYYNRFGDLIHKA